MELGVDVFAGYLTDFISSVIDPDLEPRLPMSPGVRRYINIDEAFKTGFEFYWTQNIFHSLAQQLGVAYTFAQDMERGEPLPEIAPLDLRYSLSGSFIEGKLRPEVAFRHVLKQARISEEFGETETPSFSLLSASLTYQLTGITRVNLGVNNLFDENYYEHLNRSVLGGTSPIFEPGRNFFASVNFVF
jgi:iron complex outermembrane receptor protein